MKKKLKGFTLIELIIVMAIFGVIMAAALNLMLPVSKQYQSTQQYESARASIDNIRRYIDGSLRYADRMAIYSGDDFMASDGSVDQSIIEQKVADFASRFSIDGINDSSSNPSNVDVCVMVVNNTSDGTPNVVGTDGSTLIDAYGNVATGGNESIMNGGIISQYIYSPKSDWNSALTNSGGTYSLNTSQLNIDPTPYAINEALYKDYGFNIYLGNYEYVTDTTGDNLILTKMDYTISSSNISFTIDVFKKYNNGNYKTLQQSTALSFGLINTLKSDGSVLDDNITVQKYKTDVSGTTIPLTSSDIGKNNANPANLGDIYDTSDFGSSSGVIEELYKLKTIGSRFTNTPSVISQVNDNFFIIYTIPKRASEITN